VNLSHAAWRKSSYSSGSNDQCVEVAAIPARIAVRDSKNPTGGAITTPAWARFVEAVKHDHIGE